MLRCLNKNLPQFTNLVKLYGETGAEALIRNYTHARSTSGDFIYPTVDQAKEYIAGSKKNAAFIAKMALSFNPNISRDELFNMLKGIVAKADSDKSKRKYPTRLIMDPRDSNIKKLNYEVFKDLSEVFPERFKIINDRTQMVTVEITDRPSTPFIEFDVIRRNFGFDASIPQIMSQMKEYAPKSAERTYGFILLLEKLQDKYGIKYKIAYNLPHKGAVINNVVHINPDAATDDTPIHEYFHMFLEAIKVSNPTMHKVLSARAPLLVNTETGNLIIDEVRAKYPTYTNLQILDETITEAVGLGARGALYEPEVTGLSFLDIIKNFFQKFINSMGLNLQFFEINLNTPITSITNGFIAQESKFDVMSFLGSKFGNFKFNALQKKSLDEQVQSLKDLNSKIVREKVPNPEKEEDDSIYRNLETGEISESVHQRYMEKFYKDLFPTPFAETPKTKFAKDCGTYFHEAIHKLMTNTPWVVIDGKQVNLIGSDGKLSPEYFKNPQKFMEALQLPFVSNPGGVDVAPPDKDTQQLDPRTTLVIYQEAIFAINNVIQTYIAKYGRDVRFLTEQRLHDSKEKVSGTTDMLILSDNKYTIIDWKTIIATRYDKYVAEGNPYVEKEMLNMYKESAYKLQMSKYVKMAHELTGLEFDEAIAIPIGLHIGNTYDPYTEVYVRDSFELESMTRQNLGDTVLQKTLQGTEARYLLPVILKSDKEKEDHIYDLITKLEFLLNKYVSKNSKGNTDVKKELREIRYYEIRKIIQDLTIRRNAASIVSRINTLIKIAEEEILKENTDVSLDKVQDLIDELSVYRTISHFFPIENEGDTPTERARRQETASKLAVSERLVFNTLNSLTAKRNNIFIDEAKGFGIDNLTSNEKAYSHIKRYFRETSAISDVKTISHFWAIKESLTNKAHREKRDTFKQFKEFLNLTQTDFDFFFQKNEKGERVPRLITQYDPAVIIEQFNVLNNEGRQDDAYELEAIFEIDMEKYNISQKQYIEYVNSQLPYTDYSEDPNATSEMLEREEAIFLRREKLIAEWNSKNGSPFILNDEGQAVRINWRFFKINESLATQFETENFKKLKQSPERLKLFKLIKQLNQEAYETGLISNAQTFYPSVFLTKKEKLFTEGDFKSIFTDVFSNKSMEAGVEDEETAARVEIDPFTGQAVFKLKKMYQDNLSIKRADGTYDYSNYSFNLIKNYVTFFNHLKDYQVKQELEEKTQYLLAIEKGKSNLIVKPNGKIQVTANDVGILVAEEQQGVNLNYDLFKKLSEYYLYGRTGFSDSNWKIGNWSAVKMLRKTMAWRSVTTLGLNLLSASSALFGGFSNIILEANRNGFFNKEDIMKGVAMQGKILFKDKQALDALSMIHQIDPLIDDLTNEREKRLSVSKIDAHLTEDRLYILLRSVDKFIQYVVGYASLNNHMIVNDKLYNIREYVKQEMNFDQQFEELTALKQWSKVSELEEELNKKEAELKKTDSLLAKPQDLSPEHIDRLRSLNRKLSSKIIGNASQEDIIAAKTTMLGSVAMQFKNWIPRLATERFGDPEMDRTTNKLNWGKYLTTVNLISKQGLDLVKSAFGQLNDVSFEKIQKKYEEMLEQHILNGGTPENFVSLSEFKDLYLSNIRSTLKELTLVISLMTLIFSLKAAWDDDEALNGYQRLALNALSKFENELTFFWNPSSLSDLLNKPFPVVQTLTDVQSFLAHTNKEVFNQAQDVFTDNEAADLKSAKPAKYFFKLFPITKEMINWLAIIDDDFRKNWDIKLNYK